MNDADSQALLTIAALDVRDSLANLIPKIDRARTPAAAQAVLDEVRRVAHLHEGRLRIALKQPVRSFARSA